MTQFEHEQLATMAEGWKLRAETTADTSEARILKSNAEELRLFLRHADTAPGEAPEGEPDRLTPIGSPRVPSFTQSEFPTGIDPRGAR